MNSKPTRFLAIAAACLCGAATWASPSAIAATPSARPRAAIVADYDVAAAALPRYSLPVRVDPRFRKQMAGEFTAPLQREVALLQELAAVDGPKVGAGNLEAQTIDLAMLDLFGDASAAKTLEEASSSTDPRQVLVGKVGLLVFHWWSNVDADAQAKILDEFTALAQASPKFDPLVNALLTVAQSNAANNDVAMAARDIVEKDLTGLAAKKYKARPDKLGRPLVLTGMDVKTHKKISTADWKGKVIVLDFWATWCPPCMKALPEVVQLYKENHDKGLEVVGIDNDYTPADLLGFLATNKEMAWPQFYGPAGPQQWNRLSLKFEVSGIPTMYVIDRNGILRDIEVVSIPKELIGKLLEETADPKAPKAPPQSVVAQ
jgi:thiol-disulfide isomerase/thioredoxin